MVRKTHQRQKDLGTAWNPQLRTYLQKNGSSCSNIARDYTNKWLSVSYLGATTYETHQNPGGELLLGSSGQVLKSMIRQPAPIVRTQSPICTILPQLLLWLTQLSTQPDSENCA